MSRSFRCKKGYCYLSVTASGMNKGIHDDKKENSRRLRRRAKVLLNSCHDYDDLVLPERLESVMERWDYRDDGRYYHSLMDILEYKYPWQYIRK